MKSLFFFLLVSCAHGQNVDKTEASDLKVGAERIEKYIDLIKDRRIGLVGNQTSVINGVHAVDTFLAMGLKVQRVFSPEHGFRGDADAGELVNAQKDQRTGLPIYSLYGNTKKPDKNSLADIDVMIFDIQDVGVRFYTYISTLHYVMEACAESGIPLIVLDRPNPNGHYVDGPVLDTNFRSFVGMHPIPIVHGMTIGEYAKMINGEGWLPGGMICDLTVIIVANYDHQTFYSLPIPPSPNLRTDLAISLYPSLCLLEATTVTVGRGTEHPFEVYGHPLFPETSFSFVPQPGFGSKEPKHKGVKCNGFHLTDSIYLRMEQLDLSFLINSNSLLNGKLFVDKEKFFNLLAGNDVLLKQITSGMSQEDIRLTWQDGLQKFALTRAKYLLYD